MSDLAYRPLNVNGNDDEPVLIIPNLVKQKKQFSTLYITDLPFCANKAIDGGLPVIGYKGINDQHSDTLRQLEPELVQLLQKKKVHSVVLLYNADVLDTNFTPGDKDRDLAKKFYNIYYAVKYFNAALHDVDNSITLWFVHPKHSYYLANNVKTFDDFYAQSETALIALKNYKEKENKYFERINLSEFSLSKLNTHLKLKDAISFYAYHCEKLKGYNFTFKSVEYSHDGDKLEKIQHTDMKLYLRVGPDYYKRVMVKNSLKQFEEVLIPWKPGEISSDYGSQFKKDLPRYDSFINIPSNNGEYQRVHTINHNNITSELYNLYSPIDHDPVAGEWPHIEKFLKHIFAAHNADGEVLYEFGLDYLQLSYLDPTQRLPVLCLVSTERNTGKTTFLNLLKQIFGANAALLDNERFNPKFTSHFAGKLFVTLDEGHIPVNDKMTKEMIKNLATGRTMWLEGKGTNAKGVDNYTHLVLCSNNEKNFMQIDPGENRFAVLKVKSFKKEGQKDDPDLVDKMQKEIPHFLNFLNNRRLHYAEKTSRFWFPDHVYVTEALQVVMNRTKDTLEQEIEEFLVDAFMNFKRLELYYTLTDLTAEINKGDYTFHKAVIKHFLQDRYNITPGPSLRYSFFTTDEQGEPLEQGKKGRYCTFQAADFLTEEEFKCVFNNSEKCVPKVPFVPPVDKRVIINN